MSYADFDVSRKRKFNNMTITVIVLSENATEEVKNDLFERINKGSDILRNMETRKGIYRGAFTDFIYDECANNQKFRNSVILSKTVQNRQEHEELVLRFFALIDLRPKYSDFSRSVSKALDDYMDRKRETFSEEEKQQKLFIFNRMVDFVTENFEFGFSKSAGKEVSRIFFEAISVGCHLALEEAPNLKPPKKVDVRFFFSDRDFNKSVTGQYRTHSTDNLNKRINYIKDRILSFSVKN
ncbi:hypothetical protein D3C76_1066320 [compost metagenome]